MSNNAPNQLLNVATLPLAPTQQFSKEPQEILTDSQRDLNITAKQQEIGKGKLLHRISITANKLKAKLSDGDTAFPPVKPKLLSDCSGRKKGLFIGVNYFGTPHQLNGCWVDVK